MATLFVDKVDPQSGTSLEIGSNGDTISVPSGATLDIASGATLDTTGATVTGISGNPITEADTFGLTSTQSISSGTDTVLTGFNRDNEATFSKIGTGLSESSGVFTFGATGIYWVAASFYMQINGDLTYASPKIAGTTNNSSYVNLVYNDQSIKQVVGNTYACNYLSAIFDCQDTSTHKVRLSIYGTQALNVLGGANDRHTYITVFRLGDT
jgi:hypothetical protein